ncbi:YaiO family outer membrane beta-barrel protein [Sulfurimonas sp. HSL1-6]|uniref:YaiO family outer membrane beta-barrel protein n=1 Tax=Thiomicrolovo immobilis TaxID=3131935 RepID=UPI0031F7B234
MKRTFLPLILLPVCLSAEIFSARLGHFETASEAEGARARLSAGLAPYCVTYAEPGEYSVRCLVGSRDADIRQMAVALGVGDFETVKDDPGRIRQLFIDHLYETARARGAPAACDASRMLTEAFPGDGAVLKQYATLLFWSGRTGEAATQFGRLVSLDPAYGNDKVYLQVRTTLLLEKGEALLEEAPTEVPALIDGEPEAVRNAYDVMLLRVRALIRLGALPKAEAADRALLERYPASAEAEAILTDLLRWQGKYAEAAERLQQSYTRNANCNTGKKLAALYLEAGEPGKAEALLETLVAEQPGDLETTRLYVTVLLRLHEKSKAGAAVSALDGQALETFRKTYPQLYCRTMVHAFEAGAESAGYSDNRDDDGRVYAGVEVPIARSVLVATAERVWRYGLYDTNVRGELYGAFGNGTWGYLSFSAAPDADFLPRYSLGGHLYKGVGHFEFGMGYVYSHYKESDTHLLVPEYSLYFGDRYTWNQKFYWIPESGSYALLNLLKYESACRWEAMLSYTRASSSEKVDIGNVFSHTDADMFRGEGSYRLTPEWMAGAALFYDHYRSDTATFDRRGASVYVKRYW